MRIQVRDPDKALAALEMKALQAKPNTELQLTFYLNLVQHQLQEMQVVREKVYAMEQTHLALKQKYERLHPAPKEIHTNLSRYDEEIARLHRELEARGGNPRPTGIGGAPPQNAGPSGQAPPAIGHGPSNLFGGIMAGQGPGGPGLAPPPQSDQHGPPQHQMPQPGPPPPPALQGPPPQQQPPFQGGYAQGPAPNGYGSQPPQSTASPGPGKGRVLNRGPGGPATPQLNQPMPYPDPRAAASPQVGHPMPTQHPQFRVGNALAELDLERLPAHQKKVESDWFAIFNPEVPRVLDVDLLHTLQHESVVCCVRFSHDGKYVATGCNRSAQIFDVFTGQKICILQDESVDSVGDLYIRSVCFSPDGRYLATGAEDKLIRVSQLYPKYSSITNTLRSGILLPRPSEILLLAMSKISIVWISLVMAEPLLPAVVIALSVYGTLRQDRIFSRSV
jgi:glucose repression regulatory protein TUP1